ncbi:hypothetical protein TNCV_2251371 [Trichonephila clavipes]|nr:hypothetical protein TNCV_2251371 [Trichonephila clavipes]
MADCEVEGTIASPLASPERAMSPTGERRDEARNIRTRQNPFGPQERQTRISKAVCELHFSDDAIRRYTKGGNILGMAYNSEQADTSAYVFMIQSLLSPLKEIVHIMPVKKIDGENCLLLLKSYRRIFELTLLKYNKPLPKSRKLQSLNVFLDSEGILRVGGRLRLQQTLNFEQKHPMVIPKKSSF